MQKLKKWELVLAVSMAALLISLAVGGREQRTLARQVIRLHVLAHSDTEEDQRLKLLVRDAVLAQAETLLEGAASPEEAYRLLNGHLDALRAAGQRVVLDRGYSYPVHTALEECYFPTRHYRDFSLPAGRYQALRVEIGAARGHNWWCVVYPPLCSAGVEETEPAFAGLNPEQVRLIQEENTEYVIRFRCMEWWGMLQERLNG